MSSFIGSENEDDVDNIYNKQCTSVDQFYLWKSLLKHNQLPFVYKMLSAILF